MDNLLINLTVKAGLAIAALGLGRVAVSGYWLALPFSLVLALLVFTFDYRRMKAACSPNQQVPAEKAIIISSKSASEAAFSAHNDPLRNG